MNMIGHNDIAANSPTMSIMSRAPFVHKDVHDLIVSQNMFSITCAGRDETNRCIDPDTAKSLEVFVHPAVVAEGVDLGNLMPSHALTGRGQRPRLQH